MLEKRGEYDPLVYGNLRSEFLKSLDFITITPEKNVEEIQEETRKEIIKEIKEGKLG